LSCVWDVARHRLSDRALRASRKGADRYIAREASADNDRTIERPVVTAEFASSLRLGESGSLKGSSTCSLLQRQVV
jgi:hypothetical protein